MKTNKCTRFEMINALLLFSFETTDDIKFNFTEQELFAKNDEELKTIYDEYNEYLNKHDSNLTQSNMQSENDPHSLDPDSENYPTELDIANIIHRMTDKNRDEKQRFKKQATTLLNELYPKLSKEAKQRILITINPDKEKPGGRTPNDQL